MARVEKNKPNKPNKPTAKPVEDFFRAVLKAKKAKPTSARLKYEKECAKEIRSLKDDPRRYWR